MAVIAIKNTDLHLVWELTGEDLVLLVEKKGVRVFRATLKEAGRARSDAALRNIKRGAEDVKVEIRDVTQGMVLSQ